jgi:hypothetical protein
VGERCLMSVRCPSLRHWLIGEGERRWERGGVREREGEGGGGALFASVHVIKPISANSESHSVEHWEASTPAPHRSSEYI